MEFEWDDAKAAANERKHGVSFSEAATAFADPLAAIFPDEDHSNGETREILIGYSERRRLLIGEFHRAPAEPAHHQRPCRNAGRAPQPRRESDGGRAMSDELRDEYTFDYRKAKPNRFAAALKKGGRLVVLDPEVAAAFEGSNAVNAALRALLQTMPKRDPAPEGTA